MQQNHYTDMEHYHRKSQGEEEDSGRRGWEKTLCVVLISAVFLLGMMSELSVRKATLRGNRNHAITIKSKIQEGKPRLTESFAHGLGFFSRHSQDIYVSTAEKRVEMDVKCVGEESDYAMISCGCEYSEGFIVEGSRINGNGCTCRWRNMMEVENGMVKFSAHSSCVYSG